MNKPKKSLIVILVVLIFILFLLFSVSARCEAEDLVEMGCSAPARIIGEVLSREEGWRPMRTEEEWAEMRQDVDEQTRETETTETAIIEIDMEWEDFYSPACVVPPELYEAYYAIGEFEGKMLGQRLDNPERLFNFSVFNYQASFVFENKSDREFIVWYFPRNGQHVEFGRWGADYVEPHTKKVIGGYVSYHHSLSQDGEENYSRGIETVLVLYRSEDCDDIKPFIVYNPDGSQNVEKIPLYKYFVLVPDPEEHYIDLGGGYKKIEKNF